MTDKLPATRKGVLALAASMGMTLDEADDGNVTIDAPKGMHLCVNGDHSSCTSYDGVETPAERAAFWRHVASEILMGLEPCDMEGPDCEDFAE